MNFRPLALAGAIALACTGAFAEDFNQNVPWMLDASTTGAGSASLGVTHLEAGMFTDTFTFTGLSAGVFTGSLVTIGFSDTNNIDFTSVSVNGQSYNLVGNGLGTEIATFLPQPVNGAIVLTVMGVAGPSLADGTAISASYAGTANLAPVPELQTYAMMLAGLGMMGMLSRRRLGG